MGRGLLVFKGDKHTKEKKKKKTKHTKEHAAIQQSVPIPVAKASLPEEPKHKQAPKLQNGTGQLTTSGTVVTGHNTRFQKDLAVGDAILVNVNGNQEMRVITMCLSDSSLNLSSSFSHNLSEPTQFQFIRKPRAKDSSIVAKQKAAEELASAGRQAAGLYGTGSNANELVYREKTEHGSYRIRRVQVADKDVSRGDLLEMRTKKKSDKYC